MKRLMMIATTLAASSSLVLADSSATDDVKGAAQKLGQADNYSWTQTMEIANSQYTPRPSHGKTEKDGFTYMDFTMRDNTIEAYVKGDKGAIKTEDGWQSLEDAVKPNADGSRNPGQFMARRMQNLKTPAKQAEDILGKVKDLTKTDDIYAGDMTQDGAKSLMTFGRRRGGQAPNISDAKGTVKFWVKDGVLTKYQYRLQGTRKNQDGDDVEMDMTTTVEIKDVGATKVTVPEEAKGKMS